MFKFHFLCNANKTKMTTATTITTSTCTATVIGIGAMGGGMARTLLRHESITKVIGLDKNPNLVERFCQEAHSMGKGYDHLVLCSDLQSSVRLANIVILVLVNEAQCASVCYGDPNSQHDDLGLLDIMSAGQGLMLCSTVRPTFAKELNDKFRAKDIYFVDCPISGGPVRAKDGELTMMSSGDDLSLQFASPYLKIMGSSDGVYNCGEAGMGSTVKMVHQLLAGTHIAAAAEALSLAAKAGVDMQLMYDVVSRAAGSSWMFMDRGARMIQEGEPEVKSAMNIFVKDLDIVYSEAKSLACPIPIASTVLQQFLSGVGLGLGNKDDSQLVKVYENFTGVSVNKVKQQPQIVDEQNERKLGDEVGDFWEVKPGIFEKILEVADEPAHNVAIQNEFTRVIKVKFNPNYTTLAHRHAEDSLYYFLVEDGLNVINHVKGADPACDCMTFGEVRFGNHKQDKPLVHKITNMTDKAMFCIDAEVLKTPPITCPLPLIANYHDLIKTRDKCRIYHFKLSPGEKVTVTYPFFYLLVVLKKAVVKVSYGNPALSWAQHYELGDVQWKEPCVDITFENVGETDYESYISEWR